MKRSRKFYADWGTDAKIHFDDWWITHSHLFVDEGKVRILSAGEGMDAEHVYLAVPKTRSLNAAVDEVREVLAEHFKVSRSKRTHAPLHRFAPTEVQGFKRETMRLHLDLQRNVFTDGSLRGDSLYNRVREYLKTERYKKRKNVLPSPLADLDMDDEGAKRNLRRYKMRCSKLLLNVASGIFPGSY